jgi:hypothetical protein
VSDTHVPKHICWPTGQFADGFSPESGLVVMPESGPSMGGSCVGAGIAPGSGNTPASSAVTSVPGLLSRIELQPRKAKARTLEVSSAPRMGRIIGNSLGA